MNQKHYTVVSGYWAGEAEGNKADFFQTWWDNTTRWLSPVDVFIVNNGSKTEPLRKHGKWVDLSFNAGHLHALFSQPRDEHHRFVGGSYAILIGILIAAANGTDLVFKEQDCLVSGDCESEMYRLSQTAGIVSGHPQFSMSANGVEQSFTFVRRDTLLWFVEQWIKQKECDADFIPEQKWLKIFQENPGVATYFPFGYGRSRRFDWQTITQPFFIQQVNTAEVNIMKSKGLL